MHGWERRPADSLASGAPRKDTLTVPEVSSSTGNRAIRPLSPDSRMNPSLAAGANFPQGGCLMGQKGTLYTFTNAAGSATTIILRFRLDKPESANPVCGDNGAPLSRAPRAVCHMEGIHG